MEATQIDGGSATPNSTEPLRASKFCYLQTQGNLALVHEIMVTCLGEQIKEICDNHTKLNCT